MGGLTVSKSPNNLNFMCGLRACRETATEIACQKTINVDLCAVGPKRNVYGFLKHIGASGAVGSGTSFQSECRL